MSETTYDLSRRSRPTARTWLFFIAALAAFLLMVGLVAVACTTRPGPGEPAAGTGAAGLGTATPTPPASEQPADPVGPGGGPPDGGGGGEGDDDGGPADDDQPEEPEEPEEPLFPVFPVGLPSVTASVSPETVATTACPGTTNVTVKGALSVDGGLPAFYPVTVEYRWLVGGEPGLTQAAHFAEAGTKQVTTTVAVSGNTTVAIEVLSPGGHTSAAAPVQLLCA